MHTIEAARQSLAVIRQEMRLHSGPKVVPDIQRLMVLRASSRAILDRWPKLRDCTR
jgi:hypothetical protein